MTSQISIETAIQLLLNGNLIGLPTEYSFALATQVNSNKGLQQLEKIKQGRSNPIGLMAANLDQIKAVIDKFNISESIQSLIDRYWPGPLTIIFDANPKLSHIITAGSGSVGVRLPEDTILQSILSKLDLPVTATSANFPGQTPICKVDDFVRIFPDLKVLRKVQQTPGNLPSTVVDARKEKLEIIRQGAIEIELAEFNR